MNLPLLPRLPRRAAPDAAIMPTPLILRSSARSHVGLVRSINEDRVFECSERGLWAVADGMGGHRGGDLAAASVIEALRALVEHPDDLSPDAVLGALHNANRDICARNRREHSNAGTTVVAAFADHDVMTIFWAGDSRAYRVRGGEPALCTKDHSVVQDLVDAGLITAEAATSHPQANIVTRALGVADEVMIDWKSFDFRRGDRILLCSDGLSRSIRPTDLLSDDEDIAIATAGLVECALFRDGSDNTTVVLIEAA